MHTIILISLGAIFVLVCAFVVFLMIENNLPNNITKKKGVIEFFTSWRLFFGMIITGFSAIMAIMIEELIDDGIVIVTINNALFWFFIGAGGIGLFIGGVWQEKYRTSKTTNL